MKHGKSGSLERIGDSYATIAGTKAGKIADTSYQKPLRGYLKSIDYSDLEKTKDLLYGEFDVDRFEKQVRASIAMPRKVDKLMQMQPSAQAVDQLMHNCHTYFDEIAQI